MVALGLFGCIISIHALRVEGDGVFMAFLYQDMPFLSTPFSQKATKIQLLFNKLIAVAGTNVGMNAF